MYGLPKKVFFKDNNNDLALKQIPYVLTQAGLLIPQRHSIDGTLETVSNGDNLNRRGLAANRPSPDSVVVGTTYWSVDTDPHADGVEVSNGISWELI